MARKNDPEIQENVDHGAEDEQNPEGIDARKNNLSGGEDTRPSDAIKNANAAGLGAIGRNDQPQTGHNSNHSGNK